MPRFRSALALAVPALALAAAGVPGRADESARAAAGGAPAAEAAPAAAVEIELGAADAWEPGETVTMKFTEEAVFRLTAEGPRDGRPLPARLVTVGFAGRYVVRCDAVDATGGRARALVHLAEWRHDTPDRRDRSVEGAFVEVTPAGWTLVGSLVNPSPEARKWLDSEFGPGASARGTDLAGLRPPARVAVGATWDTDLGASLAALLDLTPIPVEAVRPAFRPKLENAIVSGAGAVVRVVGEMETPLAAEPGAPALAGDANVLRVRGEFAGTPNAWHRTGAVSLHGDMALSATTDRTAVRCAGTLDRRRTATPGGRVPEPPPRDAAAGTLLRIARRAPWHVGDSFAEVGRDAAEPPVAAASRGAAETVSWTAVHTCRELDEAGFPRRMSVEFREWEATSAKTADTSLRGVTIDVRPGGWAIVPAAAPAGDGSAPEVSRRAREWLDREFARTSIDDTTRAAVAPSMAVAVRDEWIPDEREVRGVVGGWLGLPLGGDAELSAALDAIEGDESGVVAKVRYRFGFPVSASAGAPDDDPLRGASVEVEGETTGAAGEWERACTLRETTTIRLRPGDDGAARTATVRTRTRTRAPIAAPAAAAPVPGTR